MCTYSIAYVDAANNEDPMIEKDVGTWSGDMFVALAAILFVISSCLVCPDEYVHFYVGTAIAFGLGGVGHFLEGATGSKDLICYYFVMTVAFGGDAYRSTRGYAFKKITWYVMAHRVFTIIVFTSMCIVTSITLFQLLTGDPVTTVESSFLVRAYAGRIQFGMAIVEVGGSITWFAQDHAELGWWGIVGAGANTASWTLLKTQPFFFSRFGMVDKTTVLHRLDHYLQYLTLWSLQVLSLRKKIKSLGTTPWDE